MMTREGYIRSILDLYYEANNSDTEHRPPWINKDACSLHCNAYEKILHDLAVDDREYQQFIDSIF
tara:strand:- start:1127 stop:1321 length:195 start_codon:yes stop_codon:yes gene_type:complete